MAQIELEGCTGDGAVPTASLSHVHRFAMRFGPACGHRHAEVQLQAAVRGTHLCIAGITFGISQVDGQIPRSMVVGISMKGLEGAAVKYASQVDRELRPFFRSKPGIAQTLRRTQVAPHHVVPVAWELAAQESIDA